MRKDGTLVHPASLGLRLNGWTRRHDPKPLGRFVSHQDVQFLLEILKIEDESKLELDKCYAD